MEVKKTSKASLENERTTFFLLGFVVALSTLFVALEWRSEESLSSNWEGFSTLFIEEELLNSQDVISIEPENTEINQVEPEIVAEIDEKSIVNDDFNVVDELIEIEKIEIDESEKEALQNPQSIKVEVPLVHPLQDEIPEKNIIHTQADVMPQFKGGYTELVRFIYNQLKYPYTAMNQRIQGRVWSSFTINIDGSVADIRIEQGVHFSLDEEALRVLSTMPDWEPGKINGESVRVKIYLPIVFKL